MKRLGNRLLTFVLAAALASLTQRAAAQTPAQTEETNPPDPAPRQDALAAAPDDPQATEPSAQHELPNPFHDSRDRIYYPGDTERLKPLSTKLFGNILLDQKEIWTSPFHMRKQDSPWWIGFGAVTAALVVTDHKTSTLFENSPGQITWGNRFSQTGAAYTLVPVVAAFYGVGALTDNAQARETGVLGAEALVDSLIVVSVLKPIAGRDRPNAAATPGKFFDGGASFPSGHSIESWALASVIAHEYKHKGGKWVPYVAYGLAGLVSAARYTAQQHYASDIVAGGAMGWFIGRFVYQTHEDHAAHRHAWQPQVIPTIDAATRSYAVSLRLSKTD